MSESNSTLWNALETLIGAWANTLTDSLETDTEPDWNAFASDLTVAQQMASLLRERAERSKQLEDSLPDGAK